MVVVLKKELEKLNKLLCEMSDVIDPVDGRDSLGLYYEYCTYQPKRLDALIEELHSKFNNIWNLWESWDKRQG